MPCVNPLSGGGGSIPISQLYSMSAAQNAPVAALHDAFLNTHQLVQGSPASFVEFVDVAAQVSAQQAVSAYYARAGAVTV